MLVVNVWKPFCGECRSQMFEGVDGLWQHLLIFAYIDSYVARISTFWSILLLILSFMFIC